MNRRTQRVARLVKEEAARVIVSELRDPRIGFVTVTRVTISRDLSEARVFVTIFGAENEKLTTMKGLNGARGYVQTAIARILHTRTTPHIIFELDDSVEKTAALNDILNKIDTEREMYHPAPSGDDTENMDESQINMDESHIDEEQ